MATSRLFPRFSEALHPRLWKPNMTWLFYYRSFLFYPRVGANGLLTVLCSRYLKFSSQLTLLLRVVSILFRKEDVSGRSQLKILLLSSLKINRAKIIPAESKVKAIREIASYKAFKVLVPARPRSWTLWLTITASKIIDFFPKGELAPQSAHWPAPIVCTTF